MDAKSIQGTPVQDIDPTEAGDVLVSVVDAGSPTGFAYVRSQITQDMIHPGVSITSFALTGGASKEVGQHLVNPAFTAAFSTPPSSVTIQRVGGAVVDVTSTPTAFGYTGDFVHSTLGQTETFILTAIMNGVTKTATITVVWGVLLFYGVRTDPGSYDEAFIEGLASSTLRTFAFNDTDARALTIAANAGAGQYLFVFAPDVLTLAQFFVPPVEILPDDLGAFSRTNAFTPPVTNAGRLYRVSPAALGSYSLVIK